VWGYWVLGNLIITKFFVSIPITIFTLREPFTWTFCLRLKSSNIRKKPNTRLIRIFESLGKISKTITIVTLGIVNNGEKKNKGGCLVIFKKIEKICKFF
jgi:hypothetical protein